MRKLFCLLGMLLLLMSGIPALADSIMPASYSTTLAVGGTATLAKTVTITREITAPVDIMFMSDTTGSMGGTINSVKAGVLGIIGATALVSPNTQYAVGEYRDRYDSFVYRLNQGMTGDVALVQNGVNSWFAGGGADQPEANLYALKQAALGAGWRPFSTRMLFWMGDNSGHDPGGPLSDPTTEVQATAALTGSNIRVYPISVGSPGLNANSGGASGEGGASTAGQATRIATATGGQVVSGSYGEATTLITNMILTGLSEYGSVGLAIIGLAPGLEVTLSPAFTGDWERDADRPFAFTVGFKGITPGVYDFDIAAVVDGTFVAYEHDSITVGAIPEPGSIILLGTVMLGVATAIHRRRRRV